MDPVRTEGHEYEEPPSHTYLFLVLGTRYFHRVFAKASSGLVSVI